MDGSGRAQGVEEGPGERPAAKRGSLPIVLAGLSAAVFAARYLYVESERSKIEQMNQTFAAAAALQSAPPTLVKVDLPGMSVEAPAGGKLTGEYVSGSYGASFPQEWSVAWQRGALPPVEEMKPIVAGMRKGIEAQTGLKTRLGDAKKRTLGGTPGYEFEITTNGTTTLRVVFGECGGRVINIASAGSGSAKEIATRMADTFQCTPDASKDIDRDSVAVDVRPGWWRTAPTGKLMLVNAQEVVLRTDILPGGADGKVEELVPTALSAGGMTPDGRPPEERDGRKIWHASLLLDGKPREAVVVSFRCAADQRIALIYVVSMRGASIADGVALAMTGRCLAPDEKTPSFPVRP